MFWAPVASGGIALSLLLSGVPAFAAEEIRPAPQEAVLRRAAAAPVTRFELALMLYPYVSELAVKPREDLAVRASIHSFTDLAGPHRAQILALANRFDLFETFPGLTPDRFEGTRPVTRAEVAVVFNNFLRLLPETVSKAHSAHPATALFSDLSQDENQRIAGIRTAGIFKGFPDRTFRADQAFTREQFQTVEKQLSQLVHQARFTTRRERATSERQKDFFDYSLLDREF